uniref:Uncharacterized protein n=1 Tax=viral metagenome TaxID=1070528 RepID=A0A6C0JPI9_9ZZZZ
MAYRLTLDDCFKDLLEEKLDDCFKDLLEKKLDEALREKVTESDEKLEEYIENIELLKSDIIEDYFNQEDLFYSAVDCYKQIKNNLKVFDEMLKFIQKMDEDYTYDGNIEKMFHIFLYLWASKNIMECEDYDGPIMEKLEEEIDERQRAKEVLEMTPLVINRINVPNILTQNIIKFMGIKA